MDTVNINNEFIRRLPPDINSLFRDCLLYDGNIFELSKGETFVYEGEKRQKIYYIIKGSCVRFIINPEGEERAVMFHTDGFMPMVGNMYIDSHDSLVTFLLKASPAPDRYPLNRMSALITNWTSALVLYLSPIIWPNAIWFGLAPILFGGVAQLIMYCGYVRTTSKGGLKSMNLIKYECRISLISIPLMDSDTSRG